MKISPNAKPPVCKIMDYGKFRFEQAKRAKEAKKNQRVMEVKEIRMSPGIGDNDFNTKLKNAVKFLGDGDRVKVTIRFRGREMAHTDIGKDILRKFAEGCGEVGNMDKDPKLEGRNMSMFISPNRSRKLPRKRKSSRKKQNVPPGQRLPRRRKRKLPQRKRLLRKNNVNKPVFPPEERTRKPIKEIDNHAQDENSQRR